MLFSRRPSSKLVQRILLAQLENGDPAFVAASLLRLERTGVTRRKALEVLALALTAEMVEMRDTHRSFDREAYASKIDGQIRLSSGGLIEET